MHCKMLFKTLMLTYSALTEPFTVKHLTTSENCYTYMLLVRHLGLLIWQFLVLVSGLESFSTERPSEAFSGFFH